MRQIFTSPRLENVEAVARLLNEAGIETWISEARSYKGKRRRTFSYREHAASDSQPGVWIVKAEDLTRAREILREAGLLESTRPDSYLPNLPRSQHTPTEPQRFARRLRALLLLGVALASVVTLVRACSPPPETERGHIIPVSTSLL